MENWSIRPISQDDLSQIAEVERRSHIAPWTEKHFEEEMAKPYSRIFLLTDDETDEKIAGYVVFWVLGEDAQILNVVVDPPWRGQGYSRLLVLRAIQIARAENISNIRLEVRRSNIVALSLYQSLGFYICQLRKRFYSDGEDAYAMELRDPSDTIEF